MYAKERHTSEVEFRVRQIDMSLNEIAYNTLRLDGSTFLTDALGVRARNWRHDRTREGS
jgi:hypothetical protein